MSTIKKKIIAISDLEGFDIKSSIPEDCSYTDAQCCKDKKCETCSGTDIYICGDLIDSTAISGFKNINEGKKFNLQNIFNFLKYENIKLIFGNRDLNKIKCKILNKLNGDSEIIKKFNNGDINLEYDTYKKLKIEISTNIEPWYADIKNWYTFWLPLKIGEGKDWLDNKFDDKNIFLKRFYDIFGPDNAKNNGGSMNAGNLLNTIPLEIGILNIIPSKLNENEIMDYKAFIVLAIFKSLLLKPEKELWNTHCFDELYKFDSSFCKGWLYQLYVSDRSFICKYEINDIKKNIYLFSHGGLTRNIIEKAPSIYDELIKLFESKTNLYNLLTNADYFYDKLTLTGGYYTEDKTYTATYLKTKVEKINTYFNSKIKNVLDDEKYEKLPTPDMLFLMCMVTILDSKELQAKFPEKFDNLNFGKLELLTPVQPGFGIMRNNNYNFFVEDYCLYQIFGHKPLGFGTTIDLIKKNENTKLFLVILDTSNTFRATSIDNDYNKSYNFFTINPSINPYNRTYINIVNDNPNFKIINFSDNKFKITEDKIDDKKNKFFHSKGLDISKTIVLFNFINKTFENYIMKANGNEIYQVNFHGTYITNVIFSINYGLYDKSLFYLNNEDFLHFFNLKNLTGGAYYEKYLKYKNKYLQLKNNY